MKEQYYSVDQISKLLSMHPKTIQRYIREGKLRASKIGKSWKVSGHDLSLFTEVHANNVDEQLYQIPVSERVRASSVIDIKVTGRDEANRIINSMNAAMNVKPEEFGQVSLISQYIEPERTVRLTLWGNHTFMSAIFNMISAHINQDSE